MRKNLIIVGSVLMALNSFSATAGASNTTTKPVATQTPAVNTASNPEPKTLNTTTAAAANPSASEDTEDTLPPEADPTVAAAPAPTGNSKASDTIPADQKLSNNPENVSTAKSTNLSESDSNVSIYKLDGKVELTATDGSSVQIKADSKIKMEISPSKNLAEMIFKDIYQISLKIDGKDVLFKTKQSWDKYRPTSTEESLNFSDSSGEKSLGKQALNIKCTTSEKKPINSMNPDDTTTSNASNATGTGADTVTAADSITKKDITISCLSSKPCQSYRLEANNTLKLAETSVCIGETKAVETTEKKKIYTVCSIYGNEKDSTSITGALLVSEKIQEIKKIKAAGNCEAIKK